MKKPRGTGHYWVDVDPHDDNLSQCFNCDMIVEEHDKVNWADCPAMKAPDISCGVATFKGRKP